jgi:hypothetical protein
MKLRSFRMQLCGRESDGFCINRRFGSLCENGWDQLVDQWFL